MPLIIVEYRERRSNQPSFLTYESRAVGEKNRALHHSTRYPCDPLSLHTGTMFLPHEGDLCDDNLMGEGRRDYRRLRDADCYVRFSRVRFVIGGEGGEVVNNRWIDGFLSFFFENFSPTNRGYRAIHYHCH